MFSFLSEFFKKNLIEYFAPIPLKECKVIKPYLLDREGIIDGTVIIFAIPYLTKESIDQKRNLSAYAVSYDYHLYFDTLFQTLLPMLKKKFPQNHFCAFADHSPIAEVNAAAHAGLGKIGKNGLLITPRYSSYVFLGEIITDLKLSCKGFEIQACESCGLCKTICPSSNECTCLSALTQKKGSLTQKEEAMLLSNGSVWGCDLCQEVCPHTKQALIDGTIFSSIPFFSENPLPFITLETIEKMDDCEFSKRAYAWRGKNVIRRNLQVLNTPRKEK